MIPKVCDNLPLFAIKMKVMQIGKGRGDAPLSLTIMEERQYHVGRYLNSIQLEPTFVGRLDYSDCSGLQIFLDWLQNMDMYFTRYLLSEAEKVSFAAMKLTGQGSQYWSALETLRDLRGKYPT